MQIIDRMTGHRLLGLLTTSILFFASRSEDEVSSSSKPSQYPLLGFKDRHLEDDYLEYLVVASQARIILGYVTAILLYSAIFACSWVVYELGLWAEQLYKILSDEQKEAFKEDQPEGTWAKYFPMSTSTMYAFRCLVLLMFILGGLVAYLHWTQ